MEDDGDDFKFVDEEEEINQSEQNQMVEREKNANFEWYSNQQVSQEQDSKDNNEKTTNDNITNNNQIKSNKDDFDTTHLPHKFDFTKEESEKCIIPLNKIELEVKEEKDSEEIFNFVDETIRNSEFNDNIKEELEFRSVTKADEIELNSSHNIDNFDKNNIEHLEFSSQSNISKVIEHEKEMEDKTIFEFKKVVEKEIEMKQEELNVEIGYDEFNEVVEKEIEMKQEELNVEIRYNEFNEVEEKEIEMKQEELNLKIEHEVLNEEKVPQLESRNNKIKNLQIDESEIFTEQKKQEIPVNNDHILVAAEDKENVNSTRNIMYESNYTTEFAKSNYRLPTLCKENLAFPIDKDDIKQVENEDKEILIDQIKIVENSTSEHNKDIDIECMNKIQETKDEEEDDDFKDAEEASQADETNEDHKIFTQALDSKPCEEVVLNDESVSKKSNSENENIVPYDDLEFNEVAEEQDANHELQYIADSEVKISTEKNENENNQNEDDFDFNEVDEPEPELKISTEKNENENTESNLNDDDFDFNEVDEDETEIKIPTEINQDEAPLQETKIENCESKQDQNKESNEDEDFFDFVEEEEEDQNNQITKDENTNKNCELSRNSQANPDNLTKTKVSESNQSGIHIPNINKQQGKNFNLINKLLTEYKESYLNSTYFIYNSEKFTSFKDSMSSTEITNFYLDIDKNNISMKNIIDGIPSSKFEPEIELKSLTVEEINILSYSTIEEKKIKVISEKELKFKNSISEISNSTVKKLYFKFIDLKNIYLNSVQVQTHKNIHDKTSKNPKKEINNKIDDNEISIGNNKKEDALEFVDAEDQRKNKIIEKNNFPGPLENLQSSTMMNDITEPNKKDIDQLSDEEEFEEVEEEKNKNAIFIDEVLYSIMMDTNLSSKNELAPINTLIDSKAIKNSSNEISTSDSNQDFDENKMLEYLKTITLTSKTNKEHEIIENLCKEEDKNDEMFKKLIDNLPNYNFIISKYVEYPDSLFNI